MNINDIKSQGTVSSYLDTRWDIPLSLARQLTEPVIDGHAVELVSIHGDTAHVAITDLRPRSITVAGREIPCASLVKKTKTSGRRATELFWSLWNSDKPAMKAAGLSCIKIQGGWDVTGPLGSPFDGHRESSRSVADNIPAKLDEAAASDAFAAKIAAARAAGRPNPVSEKLVALHAELQAIGEDYKNPRRGQVIGEFFTELDRCGRYYFADVIEGWAFKSGTGRLYGEDTMLDMIADGTLTLDADGILSDESVEAHCGESLATA